ncbi:MAG: hypothetical protein LBH16_04560 [Treponema sp.]|jgi:hypothetical protein|nr:hypothetical protein [Treponema sp.]
MFRYIISVVLFIAGISFSIIATKGDTSSILSFINIPSFAIVGIIPFLFVSILFGIKNTGSIFLIPFKKETDKEKLIEAINYFKFLGKTIWLASFLLLLISVISLLSVDDISAYRANFAMSLLSILYAIILNVLVIIPFFVFIKKQLKV